MYLSATVFTLFEPITAQWRFFRGVPLFDALVRGEPLHPVAWNFATINYRPWGSHSEDFVILACTVLIQFTSVTDRQTDRQRDRQTDDGKDAKHSAFARKNSHRFFCGYENWNIAPTAALKIRHMRYGYDIKSHVLVFEPKWIICRIKHHYLEWSKCLGGRFREHELSFIR